MSEFLLSLRRLLVVILAVLLVISTGCQTSVEQTTLEPDAAKAAPTANLPAAPVKGARAPDFTLADLNGDKVSLGDLRGQPVLLNFWATW